MYSFLNNKANYYILLFCFTVSTNVTFANSYALEFNGINNYVLIQDNTSLDLTTGITIEAWVKVNDVTPRHMHFVSKNEGYGVTDKAYALQTNGYLEPYLFLGQICFGWTNPEPLKPNEWTHLAGTFDGSKRRFYVNGQLIYEVPCDPGAVLHVNNLPLLLGKLNKFGQYFDGQMDEVRVWKIARTTNEIQANMYKELSQIQIQDSNLVAYWNFNEGGGQAVNDQSIYNNDGQLINNPQWVISTAPLNDSSFEHENFIELTPMPGERTFFESCVYSGEIYCFLGYCGDNCWEDEVWCYDPQTDLWEVIDSLSLLGHNSYSALIGDNIFFAGGGIVAGWIKDSVFRYNIVTHDLDTLISLPEPLTTGGAFNDYGKFHILGGHNGYQPYNANYVYDPASNNWSEETRLPGGLERYGLADLDTLVFLLGGRGLGGYPASNINLIYNKNIKTFSYGESLPIAVKDMGCTVCNGKIYLFGGRVSNSVYLDVVQVYDPISNTWQLGPNLPFTWAFMGAETIDGTIYLFGGKTAEGDNYVNKVYKYVPDLSGMTIVQPDTIFSIMSNTVESKMISIYLGNFNNYDISKVEISSIAINGNLAPDSWTIVSSLSPFDGEVLQLNIDLREFISKYGWLFDTTIQQYYITGLMYDGTNFTVSGNFTYIGHISGDFNLDGIVNISDLTLMVGYIFGGLLPFPETHILDLDGDKLVSITDLSILIDIIF